MQTACVIEMANPPRAKGTKGETELLRLLETRYGIEVVRNPAGARMDLSRPGDGNEPLRVLATRPDRGQWLVTMDLDTFDRLLAAHDQLWFAPLEIEVKRRKTFAHHTLFEQELG